MSFAAPWLLAALAVLPVLWWLLRITPPAARRQDFPAIALLMDLQSPRTTAARTPWWLLALRLVAAGLGIIGFAGPIGHALGRAADADSAPLLLVIDDGWPAAPDWSERLRAASAAADAMTIPGTPISVLATARDAANMAPGIGPDMTVADLPGRLAALHPMPWPPDRAAAAAALRGVPTTTRIVYVADGIATAGDAGFIAALSRFSKVTELQATTRPVLLRPPSVEAEQLTLRAETLPGSPGQALIHAQSASGTTLSDTPMAIGPDGVGTATLLIPPDQRSRLAALRLAAPGLPGGSAGAVILLDAVSRRHPVGLLAASGPQDQPLTGPLYFIRRALATGTDLRAGSAHELLAHRLSVILAADQAITDPAAIAALTDWVRGGGTLIRFAGAILAAETAPDPLLPIPLLQGDRALGGAMSWSRPAALAPFPADSPFAGLSVSDDVRVTRQVLSQPSQDPQARIWASLSDGTPLVTATPLGAGRLVLFHVTANADWSNLPLSVLFIDMLHRLIDLSAGMLPEQATAPLVLRRSLDADGQLTDPTPAARPITAADLARTEVGPVHPAGLYGPDDALQALNLSAALPRLGAEAVPANATLRTLAAAPAARAYGPGLLAAGLLLIVLDLLLGLRLRGLVFAAVLLAVLPAAARAADSPSLDTHLAYVITNDSQADGISKAGLQGLSDAVNARTAAVLAPPVGVDPGRDDLSFYPLLYWPIVTDTPDPDGATIARLDDFMANGGIILFDTRDAGAPDAAVDAALRRIGNALAIPPLTPLTPQHVLSHSFYLLRDWPGRYADSPVWVDRRQDQANDSVSPVVIGGNDWAAAWATDASGANPYDVTGGEQQRQIAYRFGVNLVIYALTGNYKADQVHVPELLRRMGPDSDPADTDPTVPTP